MTAMVPLWYHSRSRLPDDDWRQRTTPLRQRLDNVWQPTTTSLEKPVFTGQTAYPLLREYVQRSIGSNEPMTSSEPLTRADVLTASEASRLLGIPRSTLYALARRNELPARQIGRRWVFRRSLLERATLPLSEPDSWQRTFGSPGTHRLVEIARPLPANVARSARNK